VGFTRKGGFGDPDKLFKNEKEQQLAKKWFYHFRVFILIGLKLYSR
jgi:hypothetical protein